MMSFPLGELSLSPPDPSKGFLFIDEPFLVEITLHHNGNIVSDANFSVTLSAKHTDEREGNDKLIEVYTTHETFSSYPLKKIEDKVVNVVNGMGKCMVVLKDQPLLKLSAVAKCDGTEERVLEAHAYVVLYRYKLVVREQPESTFYKDVGGKSKHMTTIIEMNDTKADQSPNTLQSLIIPLAVELVYSSDKESAPTQILTIKQDSDLNVSPNKPAVIRFRIEEVSKNHRGNRFSLKISPNPSSSRRQREVAPCFTEGIQVFSKKKKSIASFHDQEPTPSFENQSHVMMPATFILPAAAPKTDIADEANYPSKKPRNGTADEVNEQAAESSSISSNEGQLPTSIHPRSPSPVELHKISIINNCTKYLLDWVQSTLSLLEELEKRNFYFNDQPGMRAPIYRCSFCFHPMSHNDEIEHDKNCKIAATINGYRMRCKGALEMIISHIKSEVSEPIIKTETAQVEHNGGFDRNFPIKGTSFPYDLGMNGFSEIPISRIQSRGPPRLNHAMPPRMRSEDWFRLDLASMTDVERRVLYIDKKGIDRDPPRGAASSIGFATYDKSIHLIGFYILDEKAALCYEAKFQSIQTDADMKDLFFKHATINKCENRMEKLLYERSDEVCHVNRYGDRYDYVKSLIHNSKMQFDSITNDPFRWDYSRHFSK